MEELVTTSDRSGLLPGRSKDLFVVLFWRSSQGQNQETRLKLGDYDWPRCFRVVSIDLDGAQEIDEWFNVRTVPMVAVIHDGALLSMEFDFGDEACLRLADCGRWKFAQMRESYR